MKAETSALRRQIMRAVKSRDTTPEMAVRRMLHAQGYRYRLHNRTLPGCPDIVFPPLKKIIFVNGCFWHGHDCPRGSRVPKANRDYWIKKIQRNKERDSRNLDELKQLGWRSYVVWECQLKDVSILLRELMDFLE